MTTRTKRKSNIKLAIHKLKGIHDFDNDPTRFVKVCKICGFELSGLEEAEGLTLTKLQDAIKSLETHKQAQPDYTFLSSKQQKLLEKYIEIERRKNEQTQKI